MRIPCLPAALLMGSLPSLAQSPAPGAPPTGSGSVSHTPGDVVARVPGTIVDLARDGSGRVLYCTREREVGWLDPSTPARRVIAPAGSFASELRAVAATPAGEVVVADEQGDVWRFPGNALPALQVYDDLYMIQDVTDMIVDASGNFLLASRTPSNGQRGTNLVSPDGARWDYWIVRHQPVQLAADPLTGDVLLADEALGGALRLVDARARTHPSTVLDDTLRPGISSAADDGDMACEADGDVYWIAGGDVWVHRRQGGTTALFASGYDSLRGVAIAASTGRLRSATGWSLYLADGAGPTRIRELPGVGAPGGSIATDQGWVPGRGIQKTFLPGIQAFDLARDNDDDLIVAGALYGSNPSIRRIDVDTSAITIIADASVGLTGIMEGVVVAPDGTIYAVNRTGTIWRITESPFTIATVFTDPTNLVSAAKDLALDVNGTLYVADRNGWGSGDVVAVSGGTGSILLSTSESRGLSADPASGGLLVTEWNCPGFCGSVGLYDFGDGTIVTPPGFEGMNYTNDSVWGDGDTCVDVAGNVYTASEDDWSVVRYDPTAQGIVRVGSGYLNHPSGVTIARSSPGLASATGWSLYVSEYDYVWERPSFPPPATTLVDAQSSIQGLVAATVRRDDGRPRDVAFVPGSGLFVSTSAGLVLRVDLDAGTAEPFADAASGLDGDLIGLAARSDGRLVVANRSGDLFAVDTRGGAVQLLHRDDGNALNDVHGIALDAHGRVLLVDRAGDAGILYGFDGTRLVPLASAPRGLRPALDPLTGDFLVSVRGAGEGFGALQRVRRRSLRSFAARPRGLEGLAFGPDDGDLALDDAGNLYVTTARGGRVMRIDRRTSMASIVSGNHADPTAAVLAPGRDGVAGPEGTSLFLLDGWVLYEIGVDGRPAR